jgi:sugar lactone lactonase YvrE
MHRARICIFLARLAFSPVQHEATAHPPSAIAVDERGRVFFTDAQDGVFRIDVGGDVTPINPSAMHWMAFDRRGAFAEAPEAFGEWFGRITPRGGRPTLVSCSDFPCAIGRDGNLYFAKMHGLSIVRRTPAGEESILVDADDYKVDSTGPFPVSGMTCGQDGTIYVVTLDSVNKDKGTGEHVLYAINLDGQIRKIAEGFVQEKVPDGEEHPDVRPQYCRGMAVDDDGNVYIAVTGSRYVMKVTPRGEGSVVLRAKRPWSPTGVDVRDGVVYVLEYDDEKRVQDREWPLRVRRLEPDGRVDTLVTVREES